MCTFVCMYGSEGGSLCGWVGVCVFSGSGILFGVFLVLCWAWNWEENLLLLMMLLLFCKCEVSALN